MATKKLKPSTLKRALYPFIIDDVIENAADGKIEMKLIVPGQGIYSKFFNSEIDEDTDEGKELGAIWGDGVPDEIDLSTLKGRKGFVLLGSKRASGGRIEASVGPLLPEEAVLKAARQLQPLSAAQTK